MLEMEREKATSKQPEMLELKKNLQTLETKRKDDLRERDRRIADLEKGVQVEKKKRELAESKYSESKRAVGDEAEAAKRSLRNMDASLQAAQAESRLAKEELDKIKASNAHQEHELLQRLEQHRSLLNSVAQQYGSLASQSASLTTFRQLQREYTALQCRQFRLERKLANSEGQVVELTHLFRQVKERNSHLGQQLHDTLLELGFLKELQQPMASDSMDETLSLQNALSDIMKRWSDEKAELTEADKATYVLLSTYHHLKSHQLSFASSVLVKEQADAMSLAEQRQSDLSSALASHEAIATNLESIQKARTADQEALQEAVNEVAKMTTSAAVLEAQLSDVQQRLDESDSVHAVALKKEKDTIQRLTSTIQKNRMAEDALRSEIDECVVSNYLRNPY